MSYTVYSLYSSVHEKPEPIYIGLTTQPATILPGVKSGKLGKHVQAAFDGKQVVMKTLYVFHSNRDDAIVYQTNKIEQARQEKDKYRVLNRNMPAHRG